MPTAILGFDRGRHSTKAHLIVDGSERSYVAPSLAVPEPQGADPEGDPTERITIMGRTYLVGRRALATSPDALFRTVGSKTQGQAQTEFQLSFMAVLAWAAQFVDLNSHSLYVVTSAPDSEYERATPGLKEALTDSFQFTNGDGRFIGADITPDRIQVARESIAPFWAHSLTIDGRPMDRSCYLWQQVGFGDEAEAVPARVLTMGIGFRDSNVCVTDGGRRIESRSIMRGVSEVYASLFDAISLQLGYSLRGRAEVDQILTGRRHPIWSHRHPNDVQRAILEVVHSKGAALLAEAAQWAGRPDDFHAVLAAGGGSLLLKDLVRSTFGNVAFAAQADSAKGLAYAGAMKLRQR